MKRHTIGWCHQIITMVISLVFLGTACQKSPTDASQRKLLEVWFKRQPPTTLTRPYSSESHAFFATEAGYLLARNPANGALLWSQRITGSPLTGSNMVVRGEILVISSLYETLGVSTKTGHVLWSYAAPGYPIVNDPPRPGFVGGNAIDSDQSYVYVPAWGASVSALDLRDGTEFWTWQPTLPFRSGASGVKLSGDTLFVSLWSYANELGGQSKAMVFAIDRRTGNELWNVAAPVIGMGVTVFGTPAVTETTVAIAAFHGYLIAFNKSDGSFKWDFRSPESWTASLSGPVLYNSTIYHYGGDSYIYAVDSESGTVLWKAPIEGMMKGDILVTEKRVYASNGPNLFSYDRKSGRPVSIQPLEHRTDGFYGTPAASSIDGQILVGTTAGAVCLKE